MTRKYNLLIASCFIMMLAFSASAKDQDNIYLQKYGQKGFEKFQFFENAFEKRVAPYAVEKYTYETKAQILYAEKAMPAKIPASHNKHCNNGDKISLNGTNEKYYYQLLRDDKAYDIVVDLEFCSEANYNTKDKTVFSGGDWPGDTNMRFYRDGKKLFQIDRVEDYAIHGADLIVMMSEGCCNMGSFYNRYDWLTGKMLEEGALEISFDDVPSVTFDSDELILPNGEKVNDFIKKHLPANKGEAK